MKNLKLYLLTQFDNNGIDTFDSIVVAAPNEVFAKNITPLTNSNFKFHCGRAWANSPESVICEFIGTAKPGTNPGIILSSFNAG